ncbi:AmmeMemoRadiSam system protein A [Succinimonas amylolytica]|uniref:AmmeMemoRadiSam system protein A n=1 Tax=Succinimonas amylolytica TaxID=83769 RepID=UPI0003615942|nr:AmmeMemoRadiSam system protein A [Succinimonas amylolytica]
MTEANVQECLDKRLKADPWVKLAWDTVTEYVTNGKIPEVPEGLPEELLRKRAGAFVSIHKLGDLRGCIGTISPVMPNLAEEIIRNAVSAATRDPRFYPVSPEELPFLDISVDVLESPERISSPAELDIKRYGVIVSCGSRRGLLLPDLEGVDSVSQQILIACHKAGIDPGEHYTMERFEVIRHY